MSETENVNPMHDNADTAQLAYILYLTSVLIGVTAPVGVIMAYFSKNSAPEWLQTHYVYIINTFWKGLLYMVISVILMLVLIGFLLVPAVAIWWVVRCVKGLKLLSKKEPISNPKGWVL